MSVFRPAVRVAGPDGREWEVYAYRLTLPERSGRRGLRLVRRLLVDLPRAALAARRSQAWTIEAITWQPHRTSYTWTTTGEFRGHVLAQVEAGIARGEVPRPRHATFLGASG